MSDVPETVQWMIVRFLGRCLDAGIPRDTALVATRCFAEEIAAAPPSADDFLIPQSSVRPQPEPEVRGYEPMRRKALREAGLSDAGWQALRLQILERDDYRCTYCGETPPTLAVDHDVPITRGGTFERSNLVAACLPCNSRKKGLTGDEYRARLRVTA